MRVTKLAVGFSATHGLVVVEVAVASVARSLPEGHVIASCSFIVFSAKHSSHL
jgi:hypothetical protein